MLRINTFVPKLSVFAPLRFISNKKQVVTVSRISQLPGHAHHPDTGAEYAGDGGKLYGVPAYERPAIAGDDRAL